MEALTPGEGFGGGARFGRGLPGRGVGGGRGGDFGQGGVDGGGVDGGGDGDGEAAEAGLDMAEQRGGHPVEMAAAVDLLCDGGAEEFDQFREAKGEGRFHKVVITEPR